MTSSNSAGFIYARQIEVTSWIAVAVSALVIYEYLITIDREVQAVWGRPWTASSILLLSTRWAMVLSCMVECVFYMPHDPSCKAINIVYVFLAWIGIIQVAVFSGLRVLGITGGSRTLAALVLWLGLIPAGVNIIVVIKTQFLRVPRCNPVLSLSQRTDLILVLICRISSIIVDLLVVTVTWKKTFWHWKDATRPPPLSSISACLLRDGTVYFLALLLINVAQILTYHSAFAPVSILVTSMPPVLMNRFMLNLRQLRTDTHFQSYSTAIPQFQVRLSDSDRRAFTSIIGNIGEPLVHGENEEVELVI